MAVASVVQSVMSAKRAGAPLVGVESADPYGFVRLLVEAVADGRAVVVWDCLSGPRGANDRGTAEVQRLIPAEEVPGVVPGRDFSECVGFLSNMAQGSILVALSAHLVLAGGLPAVQTVINARDVWERAGLMLLLLGQTGVPLPVEVAGDVLSFADPLPDATARAAIIGEVVQDARAAKSSIVCAASDIAAAVDALSGLTAFAVKQTSALSFVERGALDGPYLWERKRQGVSAIKGLSMDSLTGSTLADVGGLSYIRELSGKLAGGAEPFAVVVRIEEIEKGIGAALTETSGTGRDQLFTLLDRMESRGWGGLIAVGPPGSGKSYYAETLARTFGRPSIKLDLGGLKGSLVGESEAAIRRALDTVDAIGGARVFFVATSNGLESVPPELLRRFWHGVYMFDLPTSDERAQVWGVNLKRYGLAARAAEVASIEARGVDWTSAEIRNICRYAYLFGETLAAASQRVAPYCIAGAAKLLKLRQAAAAGWLSASYGGFYSLPGTGAASMSAGGRKLDLGGA